MQRYSKFAAMLGLFILLGFGIVYWQHLLTTSLRSYRSFLTNTLLLSDDSLTRQTERVVLVIIGGVGFDAIQAANLPTFERLQESGASALMLGQTPSYDHPAWLTLISGVHPRFNNGQLFMVEPETLPPSALNTIFHNAKKRGLSTALVGPEIWRSILEPDLLDVSIFTLFTDAQGDQQLLDNLTSLLNESSPELLLIYIAQINDAGRRFGGTESQGYQDAVEAVDIYLNELVSMLDFDQTTLIITADHGHIEQGGYGGHDPAVLQLPFVMVGQKTIPGVYSPIEQADIAPTIATLLGTGLPAANQGRPLTEMLQLSDADRAAVMIALARQRFILADAYLQALNGPLPDSSEINKAQGFLTNNNFMGAAQLAQLLVAQLDQTVSQAEAARLKVERLNRLLIVLVGGVGLITLILWRRSALWQQALLTAAIVVGVYHSLYLLEQHPYSFSTIANLDAVGDGISARVALSMAVGGLFYLILLALQQYTRHYIIMLSCYEMVLFIVLGFLGPAIYAFWHFGFEASWIFPDMSLLFLQMTGLVQALYAIVIGMFVPLVIILFNYQMQKWILTYQQRRLVKLRAESPVNGRQL